MQDKLTVADDAAQVADVLAHGFMTLIADGCQRLQVTVDPPTGKVAWVVHVKAYPANLSIHLSRAGLVLLADRIGQAIQDCDIASDESDPTTPDYPGDDGDGVDLDDTALTSGPEAEVTCCVCGKDVPGDGGVRVVATDHGPDNVCGECEYPDETGGPEVA